MPKRQCFLLATTAALLHRHASSDGQQLCRQTLQKSRLWLKQSVLVVVVVSCLLLFRHRYPQISPQQLRMQASALPPALRLLSSTRP